MIAAPRPRAVVLVEGASDQVALETLARRRDRSLREEGVAVLPMGGVSAIARHLGEWGPAGHDVTVAGLYDAGEEHQVRRALERAGLGRGLTRDAMAGLGFEVCVADLEDELIRALGVAAVEEVVAERGELASLMRFRAQPAQRGRPATAQLRRFMGTRSGRKVAYARALVEALDLSHVPRPLDAVLAHV